MAETHKSNEAPVPTKPENTETVKGLLEKIKGDKKISLADKAEYDELISKLEAEKTDINKETRRQLNEFASQTLTNWFELFENNESFEMLKKVLTLLWKEWNIPSEINSNSFKWIAKLEVNKIDFYRDQTDWDFPWVDLKVWSMDLKDKQTTNTEIPTIPVVSSISDKINKPTTMTSEEIVWKNNITDKRIQEWYDKHFKTEEAIKTWSWKINEIDKLQWWSWNLGKNLTDAHIQVVKDFQTNNNLTSDGLIWQKTELAMEQKLQTNSSKNQQSVK